VIVTLKLYGDESADETKVRVFAVAGVLGAEPEWQPAIREWLRRTRGIPFHANKCESEYACDPDTQKHKDNLKLYADLVQILARSYLVGFAVALDLQSYHDLFPDVLPDVPYYKCFSYLLRAVATTAQRFNQLPEEDKDVRLEFTFDSRLESDGTAGTLYTMFRNQPEWKGTDIFDTKVAFEGSDEPRLEMADMLARESMKELDRKITNARPLMRISRRVLDETKKFHFIEHGREHCEQLRATLNEPDNVATMEMYHQWLHQTGRVQGGIPHDNMTNRIMFHAWLDNRDVLLKKQKGLV
jgi:hypothetical protein